MSKFIEVTEPKKIGDVVEITARLLNINSIVSVSPSSYGTAVNSRIILVRGTDVFVTQSYEELRMKLYGQTTPR
jgi:hypothetical protein